MPINVIPKKTLQSRLEQKKPPNLQFLPDPITKVDLPTNPELWTSEELGKFIRATDMKDFADLLLEQVIATSGVIQLEDYLYPSDVKLSHLAIISRGGEGAYRVCKCRNSVNLQNIPTTWTSFREITGIFVQCV